MITRDTILAILDVHLSSHKAINGKGEVADRILAALESEREGVYGLFFKNKLTIDGGIAKILLQDGSSAVVDVCELPKLCGIYWNAYKDGNTTYARSTNKWTEDGERKYKTILMHQLILPTKYGFITDHIDGDGLNNKRSNLRYATKGQNMFNSKKRKGCSSQYRGVSFVKGSGKWQSNIRVDGKNIHLGTYQSEDSAAIIYNEAAKKHFGEFARLNIIRPTKAEKGGE